MSTDKSSTCDIIQSKSFQLVGENGDINAELSLSDGFPNLSMRDQEGTVRLQVRVNQDGPAILLADSEGEVRIVIDVEGEYAGFTVYDWDDNPLVVIRVGDSGPLVSVG